MNDDFLHNLRVEPPADFLARLKSRLDLQPPPTTPPAHTFRKLLLGLFLTGSVFAITLMILNRGTSEAPVVVNNTTPTAVETVTPNPVQAPQSPAVTAKAKKPIAETWPTSGRPPTFTYLTTRGLEPYLQSVFGTTRYTKIASAESTTAVVAKFCAPDPETPAVFALLTRPITREESEACYQNVGKVFVSPLGYQAIVLARSKLYGAFNLTATDLFLALAAEIPDPDHPGKLMPNHNTSWSDVNSSLEREPIEFFGPEPSSPVGTAFREILFEAGCHALIPDSECPGIRTDGVYVQSKPTPMDMLSKLQTKPNAIGILAFGPTYQSVNELTASPIQGVLPTTDSIAGGNYPGSRTLYVIYKEGGWWSPLRSFHARTLNEQFAIIPLERTE